MSQTNGGAPDGAFADDEESLWWLTAGPLVWVGHFILSYATAAIWCARFAVDGEPGPTGWAIGGYTVIALVLIGWIGVRAARRVRTVPDHVGHDLDTPGARHRFVAFASLLLAGLSAVAVIYGALVPILVGTCR